MAAVYNELPAKMVSTNAPPGDLQAVELFINEQTGNRIPLPDITLNIKRSIQLNKEKVMKKKSTFKKPKKTLSKNQLKKAGLNGNVGRNHLKYKDLQPLNDLWKQYISDVLQLGKFKSIPTVDDTAWSEFAGKLLKADFHGAFFTVTRSTCPGYVGLSGICAVETKNTLALVGKDNKTRYIPKQTSVFEIVINDHIYTIFGKHIAFRPAERSTRKNKAKMIPTL